MNPDKAHIDAGLKDLVSIEQRLAAKVRDAQAEGAALVAQAKKRAAERDTRAAVEAAAADEERAELAAHERAKQGLEQESRARVGELEAISDARVEALARWVVERLQKGEGA